MLRSLTGFVDQTIGRTIVIEFKDESAVEGIVESCDDSMNIALCNAKYFKRRVHTAPPVELDTFFARGSHIRFIHFQFQNPDTIKTLINRTTKEEEKPRTRRVFGDQAKKLPNAFGHIKIQKHLNDSLKYYQIITPRIRSLNSTISPYSTHFSFKAYNQTFVLILRESERISSISSNFRLIDANGKDKSDRLLSSFTYYDGFLSECPHTTVSLTVSKTNDEIMGRIDTENETLYIEKLFNDTIIYRASDVKLDLSAFGPKGHSLFVPECTPTRFEEIVRSKRAINRRPVKKNRCEMKLVADYEFYKVIGNSNYYSAANYLINVIERVNKIFTSVYWGLNDHGESLVNIGFLIKEIKVYNHPTPKTQYFHFNNEFSRSGSNQFNGNELMFSFSEEEGSNASCVTVLVTAKVMEDGILGLAQIGNSHATSGICANQPHNDYYSNTAVVTVMKKEGLMITRIFDLVFTHELGHLFGASHDSPDCTNEAVNGRFIMHESANTGYDKNNYRFSQCTINEVFKVLYSVQRRCFVEEQKSLCGNGILEPGEECDGGGRFVAEQMGESAGIEDPCCTSECKLRPNALCSPKHAECCSPECSYRQADYMCQPRNNDNCRDASYCTGNSSVCPVQDNVEDGTGCSDEGTCFGGVCVPFCETLNNESRPCTCENVKDSCYRCCKQGELGKCLPITPYRYLKEGSICILGHCRNNICEKEVTDVATHFWRLFTDIKTTPGSKLFGDYLVFVVVFIITIIWIPCAFLVHRRDKKGKVIPTNEMTIISAPVHFGSHSNGIAA